MIRRTIIFLLMLCAGGTVYAHIRSHRQWDVYRWASSGNTVFVWLGNGRLDLIHEPFPPRAWDGSLFSSEVRPWVDRAPVLAGMLDFGFEWSPNNSENYVIMPLWVPLLLFAAYPTIAFIRGPLRRYRRRKRGLCLTCGYNLTGNTTGVCPECAAQVGG